MIERAPDARNLLLNDVIDAFRDAARWQERWRGTRATRLRRFLQHCALTVPRHRAIRPEQVKSTRAPLQLFPLSTREDMRDAHASLSDAVASSSLTWSTTSGASGVPLQVGRDSISMYYFVHETFAILAGRIPELRAARASGTTAVVVVNDNPDRTASIVFNPVLRVMVERRVLGRGEESDAHLVRRLRASRIPLLTARPRTLRRLMEIDSGDGLGSIRPGAILTSGDNLHDDDRRCIEEHFRCDVYNGYSSQEAGLVASECRFHTGLHMTGGALIEVADADARAHPEGSGELVVTNLENWAMPFVRYRTGDQGTVAVRRCPCGFDGPTIVEIAGRDSTYFVDASSELVNPSLLNPLFERLPILQFQVMQTAPLEFVVRFVPHARANVVSTAAEITRDLRAKLGNVAVCVERVPAIDEPGRKVQRYVCRVRRT